MFLRFLSHPLFQLAEAEYQVASRPSRFIWKRHVCAASIIFSFLMKNVVIALFIIMLVIHQDFWYWDDASLVFGFMPIGLFYHAVFSICCAVLGGLAIKYVWPTELEAHSETPVDNQSE